jgi:hypothetical protein
MPTASATSSSTSTNDLRPLLARVTRDQGPEYEQTLNFAPLTQVQTPTSIRTDRKIKWIQLHMRMRILNGATGPTLRTGPLLLSGPANVNSVAVPVAQNSNILFSLIQQIQVLGQHLKYGAQTMISVRGEAAAEYIALMLPNYVPQYTVAPNGGAPVRFGALDVTAAHFNDVEFNLPIPLFPPDVSAADAVLHCIHGPDWPGNLFVSLLFADGTALATANAPVTFTAYGSAAGSGTVDILTERPLLGKDYMAAIRSVLTYRITQSQQPTTAVVSNGGNGQVLLSLQVGKDTSRIFLKTGTQGAAESAGVVAFGSLSDLIVTRTFFSLDSRALRFQNANDDAALQDYMARSYGHSIPIGYKMIDFIQGPGPLPSNPKGAFGSSQLTAARIFQLNGDITAAVNQIAEVTQEMLLGQPGLSTVSAAAASTTTSTT